MTPWDQVPLDKNPPKLKYAIRKAGYTIAIFSSREDARNFLEACTSTDALEVSNFIKGRTSDNISISELINVFWAYR